MIRSLLYSLLILIFFAFLLIFGLFGPEQGRLAAQKLSDFFNWRFSKGRSLVDETQASIRKFNQDYSKIRVIREMTLERNQQTFKDLESVYEQARANLKELLFEMGQLTDSERAELFAEFTKLHIERAGLVESIIQDQQIMINLNQQMDNELQAMSLWLNEKAQSSSAPSSADVLKMRQYEVLRSQLLAFQARSSDLDSMRILFMRKSQESVERLAQTNNQLEIHFRELLGQVELSSPEESDGLWDKYQRLEAEQRELVDSLRSNEEFISTNQGEVINNITTIFKTIEYSSDTQMGRFRDNFAQMEGRRREMLKDMGQRQQNFLNTRPSTQRMMEDNRYRMENMRQQARQIADQYDRMDDYRKSATLMLRSMDSGLKDKNQFATQEVEDVMEKSQDRIRQFISQMESVQSRTNDLVKHGSQTVLADSPSLHRLKDMQEKNKTLLSDLKKSENELRLVREQVKRDQDAFMQAREDVALSNVELMKNARKRTEDQQRIMKENIEDQMRRLKDQRLNQK